MSAGTKISPNSCPDTLPNQLGRHFATKVVRRDALERPHGGSDSPRDAQRTSKRTPRSPKSRQGDFCPPLVLILEVPDWSGRGTFATFSYKSVVFVWKVLQKRRFGKPCVSHPPQESFALSLHAKHAGTAKGSYCMCFAMQRKNLTRPARQARGGLREAWASQRIKDP